MSEELERVEEPNPHKTGMGSGASYSGAMRSEFGVLLARGLPNGSIRQMLLAKFGVTPTTRTIKQWKKDLLDGAKAASRPTDKERRVTEYLTVLDDIGSSNADAVQELLDENELRGGIGAMSKSMSDAEYLEFQAKSLNLIHRQSVDGIRLFSDEHRASNLPEFIVLAIKQSKEPPHGDSNTGDDPAAAGSNERIIDADFEQVADIPAIRVSSSSGDSE